MTTSTPSPFVDRISQAFAAPVVVNPRRVGIAADWNFALAATSARYVTLAHQDDTYRPTFLQRSVDVLAASPDAVICFTGYLEIDDRGVPVVSKISRVKHLLEAVMLGQATCVSPARLRAFLSLGNPLPCSSVTFDRARLQGFTFLDAYQSNLDWDAWLRLIGLGLNVVRVPEPLVGRRHNALTETSRLIRDGVRAREDLLMFRRCWPRPLAELIAYVYRASYL